MVRRVLIFVSVMTITATPATALDNGYDFSAPFTISPTSLSYLAAVATNGSNFIVLYQQSGSLFGRVISEQEALIGSEFSVMPSLSNFDQVCVESDGTNYFIAGVTGGDIYATLLDASGSTIVPAFAVESAADVCERPACASDGSAFFLIWLQTRSDDGRYIKTIHGRQFDTNAAAQTTTFQINRNDIFSDYIESPDIAYADSRYFVVWTAQPVHADPSSQFAAGRLFGTNGQSVTNEFRLTSLTAEPSVSPKIVARDGLFLPVWEYQEYNNVIYAYELHLRQYDTLGNPLHPEFQAAHSHNNFFPAIGASHGSVSDGCMVFSAEEKYGLHYKIYAQLLDRNGFPLGSEFVVTDETHYNPSSVDTVAARIGSTYLCVWNYNNARLYGKLLVKNPDTITITQQPQSVLTYIGEDAIFSVDAVPASEPMTYQWYINTEPAGTSSTLLVQDVQPDADRSFIYCDIRDNDGRFIRSDAAILTLREPLFTVSIIGSPFLFADSSFAYTAIADYGDGYSFDVTGFVQWVIAPDDLFEINLEGLLTVDPVAGYHTVQITASLTDGGETHSSSYTVNVDIPFQVTSMTPAPGSTERSAPLEIVITLSDTVDPSSVTTANCTVIKAGFDDLFGTADDTAIHCVPAVSGPQEITLDISTSVLPNDLYQIRLSGIVTDNRIPLDGEFSGSFPSGDNYPYGDFAAAFSIERLITSGIIFNDNDTVTLTWEPFRDGTVYVVEYSDDVEAWLPVEPVDQWPITATTWTGGSWIGYDFRCFRVTGVVPSIYSVSPSFGYIGEFSRDIIITGFGIPLNDPSIEVSFGDGIIVHSVTPLNDTQIVANIRISLETYAGFRAVTLSTTDKVYTKENAFEVLE